MKVFRCEKCAKQLGEMTKGKIKKGTVLFCKECYDKIKMKESADKLSGLGDKGSAFDMFNGIFNK